MDHITIGTTLINLKKRMEHWFKTYIKCEADKNEFNISGLSVIEPINYKKRFIQFMKEKIISDEEYLKKNKNKFPIQKILYNNHYIDTLQ